MGPSSLGSRIRNVSIKWKLLLPFLFFAFIGTTSLTFIGLSSQEKLIRFEERRSILSLYQVFVNLVEHKQEQALSLASLIAHNLEVRRLLTERHRTALTALILPLYHELRQDFGVFHLNFHVPPGRTFLRLQKLDTYGDSLASRRSVTDAYRNGKGVAGVESGLSGLGIRGVVPVYHDHRLVGSVEAGFRFDRFFLQHLKGQLQTEVAVYELLADGRAREVSSTHPPEHVFPLTPERVRAAVQKPLILISPPERPKSAVLLGPVRSYSGDPVALVALQVDRSQTLGRLRRTRILMISLGAVGLLLSFTLTALVTHYLTRPLLGIVREAAAIAEGERESSLKPASDDEIGLLTRALNSMLASLMERRMKLQEYARTLEDKVQRRTAELVASEEKYRTLVENLPLIVYRILPDGTTEFINSFFTETLHYTAENVVGDRNFWRETVCGVRKGESDAALDTCWREGKSFRVERTVRDRQGHPHTFIDRGIPSLDETGRVRWVDGIMIDVTEFKRLQEAALRTEEIRILGEISARLAHELRNPLTTMGGFARRLRDALPAGERHRHFAEIIVEEVARLEKILGMILSSVQPVTLSLSPVDLNGLLRHCLAELEESLGAKRITLDTRLGPVPPVEGDESLLHRTFENLLHYGILSTAEGSRVTLTTELRDDYVTFSLVFPMEGLAPEDLEQFFLPRFTGKSGADAIELPLTKIIILRHGGEIAVDKDNRDHVKIQVSLPVRALGSDIAYMS